MLINVILISIVHTMLWKIFIFSLIYFFVFICDVIKHIRKCSFKGYFFNKNFDSPIWLTSFDLLEKIYVYIQLRKKNTSVRCNDDEDKQKIPTYSITCILFETMTRVFLIRIWLRKEFLSCKFYIYFFLLASIKNFVIKDVRLEG
jgi:hypothetical protein